MLVESIETEDNMIFVTLGSQKFQFNRLLQEVDRLLQAELITESVFAQIGHSDYEPKHYPYKRFLDHDEFVEMEQKADIVITHGGTGAIIGAVKKGKKVIALPRLAKYGEHVDDHQRQIVKQFQELNFICGCETVDDLESAINTVRLSEYTAYKSQTKNIIDSIEQFIQ